MTHEEEYETLVGGIDEDPTEICRRCNDYPCHCVADKIAADDWMQEPPK